MMTKIIFSKEINDIFTFLSKKNVKSASPKDLILPLLDIYHSEYGGEDTLLKMFFMENIISEDTFNAIRDSIRDLPVLSISNIHEDDKSLVNRPGLIIMDPDLSKIISQASLERDLYPLGKRREVSPSHIFLATLKVNLNIQKIFEDQGIGYHHLSKFYVDRNGIFKEVNEIMENLIEKRFKSKKKEDDQNNDKEKESFNPGDWLESMGFPFSGDDMDDEDDSPGVITNDSNKKKGMLDKFARLLGEDYNDPIIGREKEIDQLLEILGCKKKNNAILIGEAGVGKTAVVELLARRIKEKKVPKAFLNKKIYSLDLNSLVAGTKYRGQYEERLKGIIEEVTKNPDIIIYIDEIHSLVGNGGSEGSGDAANILKPHLARGTFQCIGATTFREYRKFIEKDSALKRRFQNVIIEEPSKEETLNILKGMKKTYEKYHSVQYPKEILEACVALSGRYLHDRNFPDKAVDALDLSGSLARLRNSNVDEKSNDEITMLKEALSEVRKTKCEAVAGLDWSTVEMAKKKELELINEIKKREDEYAKKEIVKVTLEDVEEAIGKRSGVPLDSIGSSDLDKLRKLDKTLKSKVIGQDEAIREIVLSLQRNSLGLRDPRRPIANLLFVGNTGTGKTLLCKQLAKEFFGSEDLLLRYDMNEYTDKTGVSKLLGSNPGYVGFDQESGFEAVRKHPYSVILIDEIDKSTDEIFQLFLNIMDEGKVTLNNGTTVDFKNTIIIFTGNVGTKDLNLFGEGIGYSSSGLTEERKNAIISKSIEKTFSPEFRNRLTKTVIFHNLTKENLKDIVKLEIAKLQSRLKSSKIKIDVSDSVRDLIIESSNLKFGGRDISRNVVKYVEEPICDFILGESDDNWKKKKIIIDRGDDKKVLVSLK